MSHNHPTSSPRQSIFRVRPQANDRAGVFPCSHCGEVIEYRYRDISHRVRCPSCKNVTRVGYRLDEDHRPNQVSLESPITDARLLRDKRRSSWRSLLIGAMLVAGLMMGGTWLNHSAQSDESKWEAEQISTQSSENDEESDQSTTAAIPELELTLAQILSLRDAEDVRAAIITARVWQQLLQDFDVPADDERSVELSLIISELSNRMQPSMPPPPEFLTRFRQVLTELRLAIQAREIDTGRELLTEADRLLDEHPDELSPYARSLVGLRFRLDQLITEVEGRARIEELLEQASRHLGLEQSTEAALAIARAKFFALRTPLSDQEFQQRDRQVEELERELLFLRGKLSVDAAQECHRARDQEARDQQIARALEFLPNYTAERVRDLLEQVRELAQQSIDAPQDTELGVRLSFYIELEEALSWYGRIGTIETLMHELLDAQRIAVSLVELDSVHLANVEQLARDALEFEIGVALQQQGDPIEVARFLAQGRRALIIAESWRSTSWWKVLDQSLRTRGNEAARHVIVEAHSAAELEDFGAALELIEVAMDLGHGNTIDEAKGFRDIWQPRYNAQRQAEAERVTLDVVTQLIQQDRPFDAWHEIDRLQNQYPDLALGDSLLRIQDELPSMLTRQLETELAFIESLRDEGNWREYRDRVTLLETLPTDTLEERIAELLESLDQFPEISAQLFDSTHEARRYYKGDLDALAILVDTLPQVIELDPTHQAAQELWEDVKPRAERRAEYFMLQAQNTRRHSRKIELYEDVIRLDPNGLLAETAERELQEVIRQQNGDASQED